MTMFATGGDSENTSACTISDEGVGQPDTRLHTGPVARLLARFSKWSEDYADYQMESGTWRKLAL